MVAWIRHPSEHRAGSRSTPGRRSPEIEGLPIKRAQARIVELLRESGDLLGEPRAITHAVKYYERGRRPLEIVTSSQWYVRNPQPPREAPRAGPRVAVAPRSHAGPLRSLGSKRLDRRLEHHVQRFFGVPFPVWYRLDDDGEVLVDGLSRPGRAPAVDPSTDVPDGFNPDQRGKPGGFVGDPDVMELHVRPSSSHRRLPANGRRTRTFSPRSSPWTCDRKRTRSSGPGFLDVVRSELEHSCLPWRHAAISGWILDPDHKRSASPWQRHHSYSSSWRSTAPTPCVTGRDRLDWAPTRYLGGADEGRPAARHQDPEREPFRPVTMDGLRVHCTCARPQVYGVDAAMLSRLAQWSTRRRPNSTPTTMRGRSKSPSRSSGPTATTPRTRKGPLLPATRPSRPTSARRLARTEPLGDPQVLPRSSPTAPRRPGPGGSRARSTAFRLALRTGPRCGRAGTRPASRDVSRR